MEFFYTTFHTRPSRKEKPISATVSAVKLASQNIVEGDVWEVVLHADDRSHMHAKKYHTFD